MRVLVTGGAGFVGSHIVDRLLEQGDDVLVVDDMSTGKRTNLPREARLEEMDIGDHALPELASSFGPDVITHCAAQAAVPVSMSDPTLDAMTNIVGGINVAKAAVSSGCRRFIYINTGGALYGEPDYLPCDEDHPVRPISAYGLSKWTMERYLQILYAGSMRVSVLRLANVFGPRQDPDGEAGVVAIFGQRMLRGEPAIIFGDGEQTRDFVYVQDAVRAHELARHAPEPVTVNIGSAVPTTVNELFRIMAEESGYRREPVHEAGRPGDVKHLVLANARAKSLLGWAPETSLVDGLRETMDWIRTQL